MALSFAFVLVAAIAAVSVVEAVELPEFLHVCSRNEPKLEECVKRSVDYLKPYLKKGVPEYHIPSLEPLVLKELVATESGGIKIRTKDVEAYGASDFYVKKLRVDLDTFRIGMDIDLPHLYIRGKYEVDGRVLLLPIKGSGPMSGNFTSCVGAVRVQCQMKNDKRVEISDFRLRISIGTGSLLLENLFGGEKVLGDVINNAINSNFDSFIHELQPLIEKALSENLLKIANSIVSQFTYDQLFPDL